MQASLIVNPVHVKRLEDPDHVVNLPSKNKTWAEYHIDASDYRQVLWELLDQEVPFVALPGESQDHVNLTNDTTIGQILKLNA